VPTPDDISALELKGGQVIKDTWYQKLVSVLMEMYEDTSPLRGGRVVEDLIPSVDAQLNIGSQVYRFNQVWAQYLYVSVGLEAASAKISTNLVMPTSRPPSPEPGSAYFDPSTSRLYIYDGTAWKSVSLA